MKKTVYFAGVPASLGNVHTSIQQASEKREEFIKSNQTLIGKIDNEDIKFITGNSPTQTVAIIMLTYYPKEV